MGFASRKNRESLSAWVGSFLFICGAVSSAQGAPLQVSDPRLRIELVASDPDLVTPIGVAVDAKGRVFVVESHTHLPAADYPGPRTDRIKMFQDRDGDRVFEIKTNFAEGLNRSMHLAFAPDGRLLVTQRDAVLALEDRDGDGRAETRTTLLRLETEEVYPHNGLGALAFGPSGFLYVGMGENFGKPYKLIGSDRQHEEIKGQGGKLFRCRADGSGLELVARGFWNPFALGFAGPHILVADNDPDARPPNRLLDVIRGADYGFRFQNGRDGVHPFGSWNGERPGTLPMIGPVGEAASGLLMASQARLPVEFTDTALVASWGDHRIEAHKLQSSGATLRADWKTLVKGGDDFRPVDLAAAPDGSVFFTDWVDKSYNVHGKGRLWRLSTKAALAPADGARTALVATQSRTKVEALLNPAGAVPRSDELRVALDDADPFVRSAATTRLESLLPIARLATKDTRPRVRLGAFLALRRVGVKDAAALVGRALRDTDETVRIAALIWAAEDRPLPAAKAKSIHEALARKPSPDLVRVYSAACERLGLAPLTAAQTPGDAALARQLEAAGTTPADLAAQRKLIWHLALSSFSGAGPVMKSLADDRSRDPQLRADAVAALALMGISKPGLEKDSEKIVARAANRAFRQQNDREVRPSDEAAWQRALAGGTGDVDAGRRVFFHPGIGCYRCHSVDGVGGQVGPDLSIIARGMEPAKLAESILSPSREIAPENATRVVTTKDGQNLEGLLQQQPDGSLLLRTAAGEPQRLSPKSIRSDIRSDVSLMPEGLQENMTIVDFRDLVAFLASRR